MPVIDQAITRFVYIERAVLSIFGTVDFGKYPDLTPLAAVDYAIMACDADPYDYREVEFNDPAATLDAYGQSAARRGWWYLTTLARIYPKCCFCGGPMEHGEDSPWLYGYRLGRSPRGSAAPPTTRPRLSRSTCRRLMRTSNMSDIERDLEQAMAQYGDDIWHRYRVAFPNDGLPMRFWQQDSEARLERLMEQAIKDGRPLTPDDLLKAQGMDPLQGDEVV
jgi:hypothetical protein